MCSCGLKCSRLRAWIKKAGNGGTANSSGVPQKLIMNFSFHSASPMKRSQRSEAGAGGKSQTYRAQGNCRFRIYDLRGRGRSQDNGRLKDAILRDGSTDRLLPERLEVPGPVGR